MAELKGRGRSGDTVDVFDSEGDWLGRGAYSPTSQIRVRMWTFNKEESIDNAFFLRRMEIALKLRTRLFDPEVTNAFRWIASESDGLPGVTIDLYDNVAVLQLLSAGAEKHRDKIVWAINKLKPGTHVYERSDVDVRKKEEYNEFHIPKALNIDIMSPHAIDGISLLRTEKPVYIYCNSGIRSKSACSMFSKMGFKKIYHLTKGINSIKKHSFENA